MKRSIAIIILLLAIAFVSLSAFINSTYNDPWRNIAGNTLLAEVSDNSIVIATPRGKSTALTLEVAASPQKRQQGLMFKESLEPNTGMFFIFNQEMPLSFWMKDTSISLDMIFLNSELKVTSIFSNTKTNQTAEIYSSKTKSMYVIETIAGWTHEHNVQEGDYFDITSSK